MPYKNLRVEINSGVAKIVLNRPPVNILNIEMMSEICSAIGSECSSRECKVIAFYGEGKAFSAGVDVGEHMGDSATRMIEVFHRMFRMLIASGKPTVAVVNGAALGGGCELAVFCDMVIASDKAKLGQPEIQLAVFPPIAAVLFPRIIGRKKALELLLTGDTIDAAEALRLGLVNQVVPQDQLNVEADKFLAKLTKLSGVALALTRKAAMIELDRQFEDDLDEVEELYLKTLMKTHDATEGLKSFLEKRRPTWTNE
ncbi:MAG: enoyl-CoA hydratase/isomerase family protein [Planctomycetota bacterium]|nr:enoyl-CoA hydratase/isomerase family protein [Planctomycetota bacterium]